MSILTNESVNLFDELLPIESGKGFGSFGGSFVSETLVEPLAEIEQALNSIVRTADFQQEYIDELKSYVGRPTALTYARNLTSKIAGAKIFFKREDLNHTGSHKINNVVGQMLVARQLQKKRIIAETGAGQHGVAVATYAARLGLQCRIYMGHADVIRQKPNVDRMNILGAEVISVKEGTATLKDAINSALRDWVSDPEQSYYLIGSALGPHPYPQMVKEFQSVIGKEARNQFLQSEECLPDKVIACVGGGSNAIGIFSGFVEDTAVELIGVEGAGQGLLTDQHACRIQRGKVGVFQGSKTLILQDSAGCSLPSHSIAAGMDYSAIGPEHAHLHSIGRARYEAVSDEQVIDAFRLLSRTEGIIPALESAHAVAFAVQEAESMSKNQSLLVNLSGRGDKDLPSFFERKSRSGEST